MPILNWLTREADVVASRKVPYCLLEEVPELSAVEQDPATENMLIQGDNLLALKSLLPLYAGKVKCIFIDPPYNTRSAFEHYDDNLEHTQWLAMMFPRLELLRELLSEDGSIWVTIDDNEAHYLKIIMDEVFGRNNFVTSFIWQKVDSPNDNKVAITPDHEYVLCYEKVQSSVGFGKQPDASILEAYPQFDQVLAKRFRDRLLKKNGKNSLRSDRPTMHFPLTAPDGSQVLPVHDDGREARWALGRAGIAKATKENRLVWKTRQKDNEACWIPYTREYAPDEPARPYATIMLDVKTTRQAKAHQKQLFENLHSFETVKTEELLQRVLSISTSRGDLVLDSFLGSATTASAAHKMGRRYIGIELWRHAETLCGPRLRKVIEGEQGGISEAVGWTGGGGFRYYRLGPEVFDEAGQIRPGIKFEHLAAHVWFSETQRALPRPKRSPLLGVHEGTAYYLLYNGVLGDRTVGGGNVLTRPLLAQLPPHEGPRIIYGESCRLRPATLKELQITFRQTPYDVRAR